MSTPQQHYQSPEQEPRVPDAPDETASQARLDSALAELRHEANVLRASQQQDFAAFRAEMAAEFAALRAATISGEGQQQTTETATATTTSRRALLKWGGLAAAAGLAAAGGATLASPTAHAADGGNLTLGSASNAAEHITTLTYDGTETGPTVFSVVSTDNDSVAIYGSAGAGVNTAAYGVLSTVGNGTTANAVFGTAGTDAHGVGGVAKGSLGWGVTGNTFDGFGAISLSDTGIDLAALGSGRIYQFPEFDMTTLSGTFAAGEQVRDLNGDLFICVTGGTPGVWKKVASLDTSYTGGANVFLSTPIRVYDSRKTGGALINNATRNVQVTGVVISGVQVPKGATGCIGNLTVTGATASGYVVIYPQGSATPSTSTVNFLSGQTVANAFAVGLSAGGQVTVHVFTSGQCHFIVDINGFVV